MAVIRCKECLRWTHGIEGECPECWPVDLSRPLAETERFVIDFVRRQDAVLNMAWVQKQIDDGLVRHDEVAFALGPQGSSEEPR